MTKTINVSDARQQWSQLLNQVYRKESRVLVEKSAIPVAAIVSAEDLQQLQALDASRAAARAALTATRAAFQDVPDDELAREVDHAVAEVRAERRAKRHAPTA
jgi:prevent-host-death family protein